MPDTQELEAGTPLAQWWRVGQAITYRGVTGAVERAIGHDLLIRDGEGHLWRIRHDNGEIQRVTIDQPTPTDLSQARIAELLKALTQGPIGDAILGLARGEMQIVLKPSLGATVYVDDFIRSGETDHTAAFQRALDFAARSNFIVEIELKAP